MKLQHKDRVEAKDILKIKDSGTERPLKEETDEESGFSGSHSSEADGTDEEVYTPRNRRSITSCSSDGRPGVPPAKAGPEKETGRQVYDRFEDRIRSRCLVCGYTGYTEAVLSHGKKQHKVISF